MSHRAWLQKPSFYLMVGVALSIGLIGTLIMVEHTSVLGLNTFLSLLILTAFSFIFCGVVFWAYERKLLWQKEVRTPKNLGAAIYGLPIEWSWSWAGEDLFKEAPDGCFSVDFLSRFLSGDLGSIRLRAFLELLEAGFIERCPDGGVRFSEEAWAHVDKEYPMPLRWLIPGLNTRPVST